MLQIEEILHEILWVAHDIHRRLGSRLCSSDVGDICNDLVVALMENDGARLGKYDPEKGSLRTWLRVVAVNNAKNSVRKSTAATNIDEVPQACLTVSPLQETHLMHRERIMAYMAAFEQLDPEEKHHIRMFYELSAQQISERLGIRPSAVRQRKCRLGQKLRRLIRVE